jgi:30S ribosomal protein S31
MGKGDKKTKRGKIVIGSYGIRRPRKKTYVPVTVEKVSVEVKAVKEKPAVKEVKVPVEAAAKKETKPVKEKKETKAENTEKTPRPKKEKKV